MDRWIKGGRKRCCMCYVLCLSRHSNFSTAPQTFGLIELSNLLLPSWCDSGASFSLQLVEMEGYDYQVILSYGGPDTCRTFIEFLYTLLADAGVRTFRGDNELHVGEEIDPYLLRAIEQSKIFIPIFSKGYASSIRWLNELAYVVDCRKRKGHVIMPIFYFVGPSEVRYQTGDDGEALHMHENRKRVDDETIRKWRAALNEVAGLKGWIVENGANRREGQLVKQVVSRVLSELKNVYLEVSDFLVGVDDSVKEVLRMIGTNTDDVKIVGIHGIGGIGKTTLAKVVYNKLSQDFANRCFLANVRETSDSKGIVSLQNTLISDLIKQEYFICCIDEGIKTMERRFSGTKVLILLDDVNEKNQLTALLGRRSYLGPGSRILITTRNVNVLREFGVKLTYLVGGLDPEMSLQLFSKHVFRRDHPPIEKMEKCREIVKIAEGLPLILEVMGSNLPLYGQEEMWDDYLVKLKERNIKGIGSLKRLNSLDKPSSSIIEGESSSEVEVSKPANTEHFSSKGVKRKYEAYMYALSQEITGRKTIIEFLTKRLEYVFSGNEGRIDNIRSNDDALMKLNSLPNDGIEWHEIGKILVSKKEIAKGSNGTIVLEGMYEGRHVAVKRLVEAHSGFASNEIRHLMASDRHENIVRYYGMENDRDFVYLALERCTCSLDDLIQVHSDSSNNSVFPDDPASMDDYKIKLESVRGMMQDVNLWEPDGYPSPQLLKLMRDVVSGLGHLHALGIIHQDLKPQNILITKNPLFRAQLSDMGISRCLPEHRSSLGYHAAGCGTLGWRAPEQLLPDGRQTRQMDLFSLGCVLFFCVTRGRHPFGEILKRDGNVIDNKMDLSLVEFIPEAHDLFERLLKQDPNLRPNVSEVLHHPFFWSSEMRLSFLRDVSDKVESEARAPDSDLLEALENTAKLVFDGNWVDKIETEVMDDLRRHRRKAYDGRCVRDLLRAVRNKFTHHMEAQKKVEEILGPVPDGLDVYFAGRFPRLLIESYRVVSEICKEEYCFQKYFVSDVLLTL